MVQDEQFTDGDATNTATPVSSPVPQQDNESLEGAVLGLGYRVGKLLGEGGMGTVYQATTASGEIVALKLIRGHLNEEARRRFLREIKAMKAIESPHVVRVIDADSAHGLPYLVMEMLRGRDLAAILREQGALDPALTARIFAEACRGLAAIHATGVIHRDIKPSNLFLHQQDGATTVKVCDFGVAKSTVSEGTASDLTHTGGIVGSPHYMSPEQVQDSKRVDHRSDLWSLSMAMYEALSGKKGWAGCSTVGELLVAVCTKDPPWLQSIAPWVPGELALIVHKNLHKDPSERFSSATEMADALEAFAAPPQDLTASTLRVTSAMRAQIAPLVSPITLSQDTLRTAPPRSRTAGIVGAVVLVTSLATGALWLRSSRDKMLGFVRVPAGASVWVQGRTTPNPSGSIQLEARPGEALSVRVKSGDKQVETTVVLTSSGDFVPGEIAVETLPTPQGSSTPEPSPSALPAASNAASAAPSVSGPPPATSTAATQKPGTPPSARSTKPSVSPPATTTAPAPPATPAPTLPFQKDW